MAIFSSKSQGKVRVGRYPLLRNLLLGFIVLSIINLVISYLFYTPKLFSIDNQNREMALKYNILEDRIRALESKINEIRHRDTYVYRSLFSVDTLAIDGIYTPYPESKYSALQGDEYSSLMTSSWKSLDNLARKTYATSLSLDQLQILAKNKERMSFAIPAIWPIDRTQLDWFYSFGMRARHPIYKTRKMHKGVDLSCKRGVPVYATGDAIVQMTDEGKRRRGYGRQILLNHEFGYQTRYAHLNKLHVAKGDTIKRRQLIADMGNTGISTSPHLHYEVIYNRSHVNPINYFDRNMSAEAYKSLMNQIQEATYESE
jgi:murein DD-endopeptidase MepM/ murein hydrolase activator NlpD